MSLPVLLICGCQKYKDSLLKAIIRFNNPLYKVIGLMGDLNNPTHFDGSILTIQVEDTYEYLPKKLRMAFSWITINFPDSPGIFKTDDDVIMQNKELFINSFKQNINTPWWGLKYYNSLRKRIPPPKCISSYSDKSLVKIQPAGAFLAGLGYYISKELLMLIINFKKYSDVGSEDVTFGSILSNMGYKPKIIRIEAGELDRENNINILRWHNIKCKNTNCVFKSHNNTNVFKYYCCGACMHGMGHGSKCQRVK